MARVLIARSSPRRFNGDAKAELKSENTTMTATITIRRPPMRRLARRPRLSARAARRTKPSLEGTLADFCLTATKEFIQIRARLGAVLRWLRGEILGGLGDPYVAE